MKPNRIVPLSEYHRLPQESQTSDFYKRLLEVVCNNATLALFIMDEHQQCVYMNPAAESLTGYRLEETKGRALHDVIHHTRPDGRPYPLCECPIDRAFPQNNREQGEEIFVHKDGHFYPVAYTASPIREGDHVIGTIIEVRDITEEKLAAQAHEALNQQLTHRVNELQTLFNLLPIGVAIATDPDCRTIRVNPYLSKLVQVPIDANASQSAPPEERPLYRLYRDGAEIPVEDLPMQYAARHQTEVRDEVVDVMHPDGRVIKLLCYASPLLDEQGQVRGALGAFVDITQRVATETALRESQALFEAFMRYSPATAYIKDEDGRYLYVNPLTERLCNLPLTAWLGKTDFDLFSAEEAQRWRNHDLTALNAGQVIEIEETLSQTDGERYFISFKFPIPRSDGRQLLGGMSLDITERRRTEIALRESEAQLRLATEGANLGMWYWDTATDKLTWTDRAKAMFGLPADTEMSIRVFLNAVHPDDRPLIQTIIGDLQAGSPQTEIEYRTQWPDGTVRWILARGSSSYDTNATLISTRGVLMDITDRKQVEAELQEGKQILDALMAYIPEGITIADAPDVMIRRVSRYGLELLGKPPQDLENIPASLHAEQWEAFHLNGITPATSDELPLTRATQQGEIVIDEEWLLRRADGTKICISCNAGPIQDKAGHIIGGVIAWRDITERKQAEAEREQLLAREQAAREAAEAANRIKDEFLAVVSHELRSPLNPILGWAKLLRSGQLDPLKTNRALEVIERNAHMQAQLINDLLDVSRILRGKLSLEAQPVDLVATIQAALETVRLAADAKSIAIHTDFDAPLAAVMGDAARLQQVVWNLLSNAVKFTPAGGSIAIRLAQVQQYAQIQVEDSGQGISAEFLPYVFDHFRQESAATTRRFGGLGLGLAIVRYLVELHGGTVEAMSAGVGQGATFSVKLPLLPASQSQPPAVAPVEASQTLAGLRILVVEDEAHTREFLAVLLELHQAQVIAVASAEAALQQVAAHRVDVIVSDIGMPEVDGYMLMRQIRALPAEQGGAIRAIALTAYAGEWDHQQAIAAGFQRHLAKPIEPLSLIQAISALCKVPNVEG